MDKSIDTRTLSRTEARVVLGLESEGREEVSLDEVELRAGGSRSFARKIVHGLKRKGWLQAVRRGRYLLNPARNGPDRLPDTDPFRLGSRLVDPYYFGYASAAELDGLLPQASRVYYIATPTAHRARRAFPVEFRFVRVDPGRWFGLRRVRRRGVPIVTSDLERTVLDCLEREEFAGGMAGVAAILWAAKPSIDYDRLGRYLRRFGDSSLRRRLGYLLERVRPSVRPPPRWIEGLLARKGESYVPLARPVQHGRTGPHDPRWRIIENLSPAELFAEVDIR